MKYTIFYIINLVFISNFVWSQGPPILLDKPIMLGQNKGTIRANYRSQNMKVNDFHILLIDADYNITNSLATSIELPFNFYQQKWDIGDLALSAKYQFYVKNAIGKTTRISAKAKQMLASGKKLETMILGMGHAMSYLGVLAARESLKLGTQVELGYFFTPKANHLNFLSAKLGFGIPLLKPTYPVNQINFYLESETIIGNRHQNKGEYGIYFAPGIQYARSLYTFELSYQFPVFQQFNHLLTYDRVSSFLIGGRIII